MLRVEALPADDGDCLWIEWPGPDGATHRMLVDGGRGDPARLPAGLAARLARQPAGQRAFDLVVCSHIDADHVGGLLALIDDPPPGFRVADVWFNGRQHLDILGPAQGDMLSGSLSRRAAPWNLAFGGAAVVVPPAGHGLPVVDLPGLRITLLSPARAQLARLAKAWPRVLADAETGLAPLPPDRDSLRSEADDREAELHTLARRQYHPDRSPANGSSIAFLAESDDGDRVLLAADAAAEMLVDSLHRIAPAGRYRVDLCKVPHHGSRHNVSPGLVELLDCGHWLVSTSGSRHRHPSREAMARILCRPGDPATAWFNYRSQTTEEYASPALGTRYGFSAIHPAPDEPGIALRLRGGRVERAR
jgi:hypothetical protein